MTFVRNVKSALACRAPWPFSAMSSSDPVATGKPKKTSVREQSLMEAKKPSVREQKSNSGSAPGKAAVKKGSKTSANSKKKSGSEGSLQEKQEDDKRKKKKKEEDEEEEESDDEEEEEEEEEEKVVKKKTKAKKTKQSKNTKKTKTSKQKKKKKYDPRTFCKVLLLEIKAGAVPLKETGFTVSHTMVVKSIDHKSPFFKGLVVGDQILCIDGQIPMTAKDIPRLIGDETSVVLRTVRPWNVNSIGEGREGINYSKNATYHEIVVGKNDENQGALTLAIQDKKMVVTGVGKDNSAVAHAFFIGDRILDINKKKAPTSVTGVMDEFKKALEKDCFCTFLVERSISIRSTPNPSLCATITTFSKKEEETAKKEEQAENEKDVNRQMGDDACEIGAREATRWNAMRKKYVGLSQLQTEKALQKPVSILKEPESEEEEDEKKGKKKKAKKSEKKKLSLNEEKNQVVKVPTDVKNISKLETVTPKSGMVCLRTRHISEEKP